MNRCLNSTFVPPVRWGVIGCGDVTEKKSGPAYQQTEGFELAAVMRRDLAKAEDYAKRHGVPRAT
ncbi:MAG: Gfo/Idh/MocA family oxidoreductase, partial [Kiritimatiellia bacterium]